jgi:hypothetical protein
MSLSADASRRSELRTFGLMFGGMLALIFGLVIPWLWSLSHPLWPWIAATVFWIAALIVPRALGPINRAWIRVGMVLGWINSRIILGLVFFLMFTPVAIVMRMVGRDAMNRKFDPDAKTYRIKSKQPDNGQLEKPY